MERSREDWVAGHVMAPVIERYAPGVGAGIGAKAGEATGSRLKAEPAAVLLADRAIRRFDLRVMKDRLTKQEVAVGRPDEVVQGVVRVFGAASAEQYLANVGLVVAVGVLEKRQVRHVGHVDAAVAKLERQRHVQVVRENGRFVSAAVAIGVFENDELVARFIARINVWIGIRAAHPHPPTRVETNLNRVGDLGKLLLAGEQVNLKSRINLKGLQLFGGGEPFVDAAGLVGFWKQWEVGVVTLRRDRVALGNVPDALVAVGNQQVEISHRRQEIEIAVGVVAATGVVERVQRSVAPKELPVLVNDGLPKRFADVRRVVAKESLVKSTGKNGVSFRGQVRTVDSQVGPGTAERLVRGLEYIDKA